MKVIVYHRNQRCREYYTCVAKAVAAKLNVPCEVRSLNILQADHSALQEPESADIYMLEGSPDGLKLALQIRAQTLLPSMIFLGAASMKLAELLRCRPSGIQLAESPEEVVLALKHCFLEYGRRRKYLIIRSKEAVYRIPFSEISYLESCQRQIIVHTQQRRLQFYGKLAEVASALPADRFIRCHQSYVVNLEKTQALNKVEHHFRLMGGEQVEISKAYYHDAAERFEAFLNR